MRACGVLVGTNHASACVAQTPSATASSAVCLRPLRFGSPVGGVMDGKWVVGGWMVGGWWMVDGRWRVVVGGWAVGGQWLGGRWAVGGGG